MGNSVYKYLGIIFALLLIPSLCFAYGGDTSSGNLAKYNLSQYKYTPKYDFKHKVACRNSYGSNQIKVKQPKLPSSHTVVHQAVPELDPIPGQSALFLLIGGVLVLNGRRRKAKS